MRRTIICCDKCNKEITSQGYSLKCEPLSDTEMVPYAPLDLCQSCLIETYNFATGKHLYKRVAAVENPEFKEAIEQMAAETEPAESQIEKQEESQIKKAADEPESKKYKPMDRQKVKELAGMGMTPAQIAKKLQHEYSGVAKYVRKLRNREAETEVERV